ncbi:MAG: hypothetical protein U7127_22750 [Phormidium sp.]
MSRLNRRAWEILRAEVEKCAGKDALSKIEQKMVLEDLEKLRSQDGKPASEEELRKIVISTYPQFRQNSLSKAAKANRSGGVWGKIKFFSILTAGTIVALAAIGTVIQTPTPEPIAQKSDQSVKNPQNKRLNLPNPLINFLSKEEHYRRAMGLAEQAERLIEEATSPADLVLGEEKLNQAKKHLNRLPVSHYRDYQPYRNYNGEWRYEQRKVYEDQFSSLRAKVERLQARVFQETQAQEQLNQAEQAINTAKQQYQEVQTTERSTVLSSWYTALNQLKQISSNTLAGKLADTKLRNYEQEYQQFYGIEAAKQFAFEAAKLGQNPPHTADVWQKVETQWEEAINRLEQFTARESASLEAEKLLATYKTNLGIVQMRRQTEESSLTALQQAKREIEYLLANSTTTFGVSDRNQMISKIQSIIDDLQKVKTGTTAYQEAQQLLQSAQKKLKEMEQSSFGS